jgi:hypothetical protein
VRDTEPLSFLYSGIFRAQSTRNMVTDRYTIVSVAEKSNVIKRVA